MEYSKKTQRSVLAITLGASFIVPFLMNALNLAIPNIGETYKASTLLLGWIVNSFLLTSAVFLLPFGRLADIIGRAKLFNLGLLLSAVSSFLCIIAGSIELFILFRIIQGISAAMGSSTAMAIMTSAYPPGERGKVLGYNAAAVYFGLTMGPVIGGFMTYNWGWVSIFVFGAIFYLILFLLAVILMRGDQVDSRESRFDWQGSIIYIIGLAAFLYSLSSLQEHWMYWIMLFCGLLLIVLFVRRETRVEHPLLPLKNLVHNRVFTFSNLAALINYAATFATVFLLSLYLQSVLRYDSRTAGFILLAQPIVMVVVSLISGRLSDRVNPNKVSSLGMLISMIALFIYTFISFDTPVYFIVANLVLAGAGFGLFSSPNSNAIMGSVEKKMYGVAASTLGSMRMIGQSMSMALATLVLNGFVGSVQLSLAPPEQLLSGLKTAFVVFGVISFFGVIAALQRGNKK